MTMYWSSFARTGQPRASNEPDWPSYSPSEAYMAFGNVPKPSAQLFPGMYALHEEAVCRRKLSGDQPWNWNVGIASPKLSDKSGCGNR